MTYAQENYPEPVITEKINVRLAPAGAGKFAARMSGPKDMNLPFRHLVKAHGGERDRDAYTFPYIDFPEFVDHLREFGAVIEPARELKPHILKLAKGIESDLNDLDERQAEMKERMNGELRPYQVTGAQYLITHRNAALFDAMGLGKTVQILVALPKNASVLVVCPASMRLQWVAEGKKWRPDIEWHYPKKVIDISNPKPGNAVICSPEGIVRATAILGDRCITLVCDEAHYYKNFEAKRTKKLSEVSGRCGRTWIATGTPMTNRPPDLKGVLRTFRMFNRAWPTVRYFDICFGQTFDKAAGKVDWPAEPPHPYSIVKALGRVAIRRSRAEVLPEIPEKTYAEIPIDLQESKVAIPETSEEQQRLYRLIDKRGLSVIPFEKYTNFSEVRAALAEAKIPQMLELIERFKEQGVPIVICSCNVAPLNELKRRGFPVIIGEVSMQKRFRYVEEFQAGKSQVIGIQTVAGGTGITLTAASHMVMVQRDWSPANNRQAEDRICRIGQKKGCVIYDILANHPLDEIISRNLKDKQDRIDKTVNRVAHTLTSGRELVDRLRTLAGYIQ